MTAPEIEIHPIDEPCATCAQPGTIAPVHHEGPPCVRCGNTLRVAGPRLDVQWFCAACIITTPIESGAL